MYYQSNFSYNNTNSLIMYDLILQPTSDPLKRNTNEIQC